MKQKIAPRTKKDTTGFILPQKSGPNYGLIAFYVLIFILAAIPFTFGKYFELSFPDPFDSAAYVYSAQHVLNGAKLGIEEIPTAQPGTLLVNLLGVKLFGFSELGPKLIQGLLQAIALVLMFYTVKRLFGKLAAAIGVIVASLYLSAPLIAKFGNVKEQHMIAFMIIGVCCYILRLLDGKWWLAVLAGAALGWAPMFKETGVSALGAVGLFSILAIIFKWRSLRQGLADIGLLAAGFLLSVGPVWAWLTAINDSAYLPYKTLWRAVFGSGASSGSNAVSISGATAVQGTNERFGSYVENARKLVKFKDQAAQVFRYYGCLILPMAMAVASVFVWLWRKTGKLVSKQPRPAPVYERFVVLLGLWWFLDSAFVWISPRGYEQYYLPLNASAAMLGGYFIAVYRDKVVASRYYPGWVLAGAAGVVAMIIMAWPIVFGITTSPFSGQAYSEPSRGYVQKWDELQRGGEQDYQNIADYIKQNSNTSDKIYVWGWYPGIYLRAQRFCPSPLAFESDMHTMSAQALAGKMQALLDAFKKEPPKFIVDSRKYEFPNDRPPLPLWPTNPIDPRTPQMRIKLHDRIGWYYFTMVQGSDAHVDQFDKDYAARLSAEYPDGEAQRYEAMKPMRDWIRHNYTIINPSGSEPPNHIVFELKK
jgi:hypothetical protein